MPLAVHKDGFLHCAWFSVYHISLLSLYSITDEETDSAHSSTNLNGYGAIDLLSFSSPAHPPEETALGSLRKPTASSDPH
jgi:hypothetical protein